MIGRTSLQCGPWRITLWEMPGRPDQWSQDDTLISCRPGPHLRAAVIDGVTPTQVTPRQAGGDGAVWAAGVCRTALRAQDDPRTALLAANAHLAAAPALLTRDRAQASVVVADLDPTRAHLVRAGDCEAWVRRGREWKRIWGPPVLKAGPRADLDRWLDEHPDSRRAQRYAAEEAIAGDVEAWITTPVGRFGDLRLQEVEIEAWDELVLATDGARLKPARLQDITGWLRELRDWERSPAGDRGPHVTLSRKRHDDVAVIHLAQGQVPTGT